MPLTLEQALARVPMWRGARDLNATPLGGGITNQNFRVDVNGESFVLRIGGADTVLLGINRQHEYAANVAAARIGIGPEVVYFIEPEGYLVTRFLNARPIPHDEIRKPENIRRVVRVLKQIHALPAIPGRFSPFRTIDDYAETARRYGVAFPKNFDRLMEYVREIEAVMSKDLLDASPCHNDLLNENFLVEDSLQRNEGKIRIIDWEYAGMGDVTFDLANFAVHQQLSDEDEKFLLVEYFGNATARRVARHKLMKIASDLREAMWGMVQIGISKLDFDFRGYADKHFARAEQMLRDDRYRESLKVFHWSWEIL